ncbi:MAG: valine--tRNA ligase [Micavibrio aeruginosavorus]|uniref:Valine--tRNA ligase n=1 Tax=Micavibrio aeruginosavorus TaxID=349221 RepID=A0A2W5MWK3_9BACT|nr:MAG: valine--tRNA ligase [Micavibrio aeruginosavorus]
MTLEKTFNPAEIEPRHYKEWEASGAFAARPESSAKPFTIMMPPPNVTGVLHMGHGLTMTLQDILTRYHRMKGEDALWMPGTDHAGISTQMVVERQLDAEKLNRRDMGRAKFLERVWEWKAYSGGTITSQLRRLGATPDWGREAFTMDANLSRAVVKVFVQLFKDGLLYRDKRLVNWDPKLQTAVSDIEVEAREVKGHMWHIQYAIEGDTARTITVATTRPETMLGDTGIAVHPDDDRYKDLIGKYAVLPIVGRLIPIVADEYADPEQGSGAVKITPAHDFNDFEVGKRNKLEMINIFDSHANLNDNVPEEYRGMERFAARKKILKELEELEVLVKVDNITHTVPHGDRSGVVIEPYLTDQWYVDAKKMCIPVAKAIEDGKTQMIPQNWEKITFDWIENLQPWCVSRQLWWGHQIPAWFDEDGKFYVAETEEEAVAQSGGKTLRRDEDVLDTWFSSALWPFSTLGWPEKTPELDKYYPGDVLVTGFDIIFFWVIRMMMMGIHFMGDVPFKKVYLHALVLDAKGQKMSKSKGNVIDPLTLIDKFGADALRFTMSASAAQGRDIRMSEDRVEGYRNFATKLWNAARFCEMNDALPKGQFDPASAKNIVNQWIVGEVANVAKAIEGALDSYKFNEASSAIYQFTWGTFCDWYLEFTKPFLAEGSDELKAEIRGTTGWVLEQILRLLNPFMPYITEELYANILKRDKGDNLLTSQWPVYSADAVKKDAADEITWVQKMISSIRSVRSDMNVPAGARIALVVQDASAQTKQRLQTYEPILKQMARLSSIDLLNGAAPARAIKAVVDEATLILPIADLIDLDKERERLQKQIAKLEDDIRKTDEKLSNQQFVDRAPPEILEEFRTRKIEALEVIKKLSTALDQLQAA